MRKTITVCDALLALLLASASAVAGLPDCQWIQAGLPDCPSAVQASPKNRVWANFEPGPFSQLADASQLLALHQAYGALAYDFAAESLVADNSVVASFKYDAFGRRIEKVISAGTAAVRYVYDGPNVIEERDQGNSVIATYVFGQGMDDILAMVRGGSRYYYVRNAHGNVAALTDSSGDVIERYRYGEYGEVTFLDATGTEKTVTSSDYGNPLLFQARNFDSETGLYYFRARYYSPALGRFLSQDPNGFADSMNLYQYCLENPINLTDPDGEYIQYLIGAAIGLWAYNFTHFDWANLRMSEDFDIKEQLLWGAAGALSGGAASYAMKGAGLISLGRGATLGSIATGSGLSAWASTFTIGATGGAAGGLTFQGFLDIGHWKFSGIGAYAESVGFGGFLGGGFSVAGKALGIGFNALKGRVAPRGIPGATRLSADEQATAGRLMEKYRIRLHESPHIGADYIDDFGRTYDALGKPAASRYWNSRQFIGSIKSHLRKSNNFTVIDLTGFTPAQIAEANAFLETLLPVELARIIRIGF